MLTKEQTLEELKLHYPEVVKFTFDVIDRRVVLYDKDNNRIDSMHLDAYKGFEVILNDTREAVSHTISYV